MSTVVDFHGHFLPGVDDGSASLEQSISMLEMEASQGIGHVVATPHFYAQHDTPKKFLARRAKAEARLREELAKREGLPQLSVGAEVYYFQGISNTDALSELTIDGKKGILIEMPMPPWTDAMYRELESIHIKQGLTPIVAHVDRYIGPLRTYGILERLDKLPVLVQANASFFLRSATRGMALRMLQGNRIHLLGSDCHNLSERAPNLDAAIQVIQRRLGPEPFADIQLCEKKILGDE